MDVRVAIGEAGQQAEQELPGQRQADPQLARGSLLLLDSSSSAASSSFSTRWQRPRNSAPSAVRLMLRVLRGTA
nr:hypothetical protein [Pseudomonas bharatica]